MASHRTNKRPVNFYCDESCHLERDGHPFMVLGALKCPASKVREVSMRLREIKQRHNVWRSLEAKWTKVSAGKGGLYLDLLDYFFDDDDLSFRAVVAPKGQLDHVRFQQEHDDWYYKMYYLLLREMLDPAEASRVYIDIKDTRGGARVEKLGQVLSNNMLDFSRDVLRGVDQVRSHQVEQMQLADLLVGLVSYANRGLCSNPAKSAMVARARARSKYDLTKSTLRQEKKLNILVWRPQEPTP